MVLLSALRGAHACYLVLQTRALRTRISARRLLLIWRTHALHAARGLSLRGTCRAAAARYYALGSNAAQLRFFSRTATALARPLGDRVHIYLPCSYPPSRARHENTCEGNATPPKLFLLRARHAYHASQGRPRFAHTRDRHRSRASLPGITHPHKPGGALRTPLHFARPRGSAAYAGRITMCKT